MKEIDTVNWGIIGCGDVTELKSGPAFNKAPNSKLVAVMRRDAEKAKDYAQRHNVAKWYSDADSLINDSEVNAIYIATPPSTHAEYAIKSMLAGKSTYVEKPMATNFKDCESMLEVSEQTGVPLYVAYYRRALPGFLKVKELIDNNTIGTPLTVNIRLFREAFDTEKDGSSWRIQPNIAGGGIFFDLASHQLDYLDFLFGQLQNVAGNASNRSGYYKAEDTVSATFSFANGVIGSGVWSFVTASCCEEDTMEIIGSDGKILFSGFNTNPIKVITSEGTIEIPYTNPENIQQFLINDVTNSILTGETSVSMGKSGARTNRVMQIITNPK